MNEVFIFDTNTLISAFLLPNSVSANAYRKAIQKGILAFSEETFKELEEVFLREKFDKYVPIELRKQVISDLIEIIIFFEPSLTIDECRDKKDNKFLELAITSNANCIVTGDDDLLVLNPFRNIPIMKANNFFNNYKDQIKV